MLNPLHLNTLLSVARTGSFAESARELGYTASAVSQQMQALERAIGRELFERGPQGVRLNAIVLQIADAARGPLTELQSLSSYIEGLVSGERGRFTIGSFGTASVGFVAAALARLAKEAPGVSLALVEGEPAEILPLVEDGSLDLGVVYEYGLAPLLASPALRVHPLMIEPLYLLTASAGSVAGAHRDMDEVLRSLADRPWISSSKGTAGADALERMCATYGFAPRVGFRTNNYDVVRELVSRGLGSAIVPELGLRTHDGVAARVLTTPRATRRISLVHRSGFLSPIAHRAVEIFTVADDLAGEERVRHSGAQPSQGEF